MKKFILTFSGWLTGFLVFAQLPSTFITKVTYREHIDVKYEMVDSPDTLGINCLTLAELAQYHFHSEESRNTEIIDESGDLLFEKDYLYERDVRDDWMASYGKIICEKTEIKVYDSEGHIIHTTDRNIDSNTIYFTNEEAVNYQYFPMDAMFYEGIKADLDSQEINYTDTLGIITANRTYQSLVYDHNTKTFMYTEFDSALYKIKETAVEYDYTDDSASYAPSKETIIEWIITEKGCCLKKTTVVSRYGYLREINPLYDVMVQSDERSSPEPSLKPDIKISYIVEANAVMILESDNQSEEYNVVVYNMAGQQLINKKVGNREMIHLPHDVRTGMYLIHVKTENGQIKSGKIIKTQYNSTF